MPRRIAARLALVCKAKIAKGRAAADDQNSALFGARGNGITSRMFLTPVV
jgi:hypothetical protein